MLLLKDKMKCVFSRKNMRRPLIKWIALACGAAAVFFAAGRLFAAPAAVHTSGEGGDFIKWVDFNVTKEAMQKAMDYDIQTHLEEVHIDWIDLLALCGVKCGGNFKNFNTADLDAMAAQLKDGTPISELITSEKYFQYYKDAYTAVLGGFLGYYYQKTETGWEEVYGLKGFSPIAKGFGFSHYRDFGNSRSYGFARRHLGNDLMGSIGTPVVAVESGVVEAIGWNRYGGWRIGIRSFDTQRYYYYAHLRKDFPYHTGLEEGSVVKAGDVIGYLGMTGYSTKENVNNINVPHLHFGMQIIFDESQKDGNNEIWIDVYDIVEFLQQNRSAVEKDEADKNYNRTIDFTERSLMEYGG